LTEMCPSSALLFGYSSFDPLDLEIFFTVKTEARFWMQNSTISCTGSCSFHFTQIQILQRMY